LFYFLFIYVLSNHLRLRRHLLRLHVVVVQVALEVEVRQLVLNGHLEELAQRRIGGDVVLGLQVLLLDVVVDLLRHVGARDERARGVTEELAELIRDLRGDLEDGRTALGRLLTLGANTALALAGILDVAVDTLVQALDLRDGGRRLLAERGQGGEDRLQVLIQRRDGRSGNGGSGIRNGNRRRNNRGRSGDNWGSSGSRLRRGGLATLGYSGRRRNGSGNRRRNGHGNGGIISLLGNNTLRLRRGSSRGAHNTSRGGSIHLN
jgi:hypothetical protein